MINNAAHIVSKLLESDADSLDWYAWPEFRDMDDATLNDFISFECEQIFVPKYSGYFAVDFRHDMLLSLQPDRHSYRLEPAELDAVLAGSDPAGGAFDRGADGEANPAPREPRQAYTPEPAPPEYSLEQKQAHAVYESGNYIFLKLPDDPMFVKREGIDMRHCLQYAHHDYCNRMRGGAIEVYSMTDKRDNKPKVDIEVALTKSSYSNNKIEKPSVTQVRGIANECPPKDEYLPALMAFFENYGKGWQLTRHSVRNFDGRTDGDLVVARWRELQAKSGRPGS